MRTFAGVVLGVVLVGCAATTSNSADEGCSDISGNYAMTEAVGDSDCPGQAGTTSKNNVTVAKEGGGFSVVLPGTTGSCPGTLDAATCRFQAQCVITDKSGATAVTYSADWTFAGKAFSGSMVGAAVAGVVGPKACTINEHDDGARL